MKYILLLILVFFPFTSALAVKVPNLYEVELPVSSQNEAAKTQAIRHGFVQVLTKVTGDSQIGNNVTIRASLARAENYVQDYSYSSSSTPDASYLILIHYNPKDINGLLKRAGIAYLGENRPSLLVWLAISKNEQGTEIIGNENSNEILGSFHQESQKFGLPLVFPVMDVGDVSQVTSDDITAMTLPTLKEAGKRYAPDGYLVGHIQQQGTSFQSKWQLALDDSQWSFTVSDSTIEKVIAYIINQVSQTLAKHMAVKTQGAPQTWLTLQVKHVTEHDDLAELMKYLKQLSLVQKVQLSQISGDQVEITVLVRGRLTPFQQHASQGQHLVLKSSDETTNTLLYEWVR